MKRLVFTLVVAAAALLGVSTPAGASNYPPDEDTRIITSSPTVTPGGNFNATVTNCLPRERVIITFEGVSRNVACDRTTLQASFPFVAPMTPGTYQVCGELTGRAATVPNGVTRPRTVCTSITVVAAGPTVPPTIPGGGLPATGSSGIDTTTTSAIVLLGAGALLLVVAQVRRRNTAAA